MGVRYDLIGRRADEYLPHAKALYKKGRLGRYSLDDILILVKKGVVRIIDLSDRFFFMYNNKTFVRVDASFHALFGVNPGAFRSQGESELTGLPVISYASCPLTPEESFVMPWVVACAPAGEMIGVKTGSFSLWKLGAGELGAYKIYPYLTSPTIPGGTTQFTRYNAATLLTGFGYNVALIIHQMNPSGNAQANVSASEFRLEIYDGTTLLDEIVMSAYPVPLKRDMVFPGFHFRMFNGPEEESPRWFYCQNGTGLSELIAAAETFEGVDAPLPALPARTRSGRHWTDAYYDVFTSPEAQHFYVVRYESDIDIDFPGGAYSANIGYYAGTALIVEKRKKSDWSLVQTFNLTPSAVDTTLMGLPVKAQTRNCDGGTAFTMLSAPRLSRFVLVGPDIGVVDSSSRIAGMAPLSCGGVIVKDGVEYPILPVHLVTQDYLYSLDDGAQRSEFLATGDTSGISKGTISQAALLWLGAPEEFGGWRWGGVDAAGLDLVDEHIGDYIAWVREPLSDSAMLLHQLDQKLSPGVTFIPVPTNPSNVDGVRYATQPLNVVCYFDLFAEEGDEFHLVLSYDLGGAEGVKETFVYTAAAGDSSADVIAALHAQINASATYSCIITAPPAGYSGDCLQVAAFSDKYLTGTAYYLRPSARQGTLNKVIRVTVPNDIPVVEIERDAPRDVPIYWYEF